MLTLPSATLRFASSFREFVQRIQSEEMSMSIQVVNVYEVDDQGKITLLRSYWDFEAAMETAF